MTGCQNSINSLQTQVQSLQTNGGVTYAIFAPSAGATVNLVTGFNLIEPSGLLATGTLNLPVGTYNGQFLNVFFLYGITLAGWTGAPANFTPTLISGDTPLGFIWDTGTNSWHRCF
jgi:hypothetical protein